MHVQYFFSSDTWLNCQKAAAAKPLRSAGSRGDVRWDLCCHHCPSICGTVYPYAIIQTLALFVFHVSLLQKQRQPSVTNYSWSVRTAAHWEWRARNLSFSMISNSSVSPRLGRRQCLRWAASPAEQYCTVLWKREQCTAQTNSGSMVSREIVPHRRQIPQFDPARASLFAVTPTSGRG